MIKLKVSYQSDTDKEKIIRSLKKDFNIIKVSKEKEGSYKRIYINLE